MAYKEDYVEIRVIRNDPKRPGQTGFEATGMGESSGVLWMANTLLESKDAEDFVIFKCNHRLRIKLHKKLEDSFEEPSVASMKEYFTDKISEYLATRMFDVSDAEIDALLDSVAASYAEDCQDQWGK